MATAEHDPAHAEGQPDGQDASACKQLETKSAAWSIACDSSSHSHHALQLEAKAEPDLGFAHTLIERAYALKIKHGQTWLLEDLQERIRALRTALEKLSEGGTGSVETDSAPLMHLSADEDLAALTTCQYELALALGDLYKYTGELSDLEEQIQCLQRALDTVSNTSVSAQGIQCELGAALRSRFIHVGNLDSDDLLKAYEIHFFLVNQQPEGDLNRPRLLYELGYTLYMGYRLADEDNLTRAVSLLKEAVPLLTESNSYCDMARCTLASALASQYLNEGDISLLHTAITLNHNILRSQSSNHPDRWQPYQALGRCMGILYERTNDLACLNEAIEYSRHAFDPNASHRLPESALNLGCTLSLRYQELGDIGDLQESINVLKLCLKGSTHGDDSVKSQLGISLSLRYNRLGAAEDLEEGIILLRVVLDACPRGHPRRRIHLTNLASSLFSRYEKYRWVNDIAEVVDLQREAVLLDQNTSTHGLAVQNLAAGLCLQYEDAGNIEMVSEAIELCEGWLIQSRTEHLSILGDFLHTYANALTLRYERDHNERDLSTAISFLEEALGCQPVGHPMRHTALIQYAEVLRHRFEGWRHPEDIERAVELLTDAFACLPDTHTDRATCLVKVAKLYLFESTPVFSIQNALEKTRQALKDANQNAQARLKGARDVLKALEQQRSSFEHDPRLRRQILDVYTLCIELLPRVAYFGLDARSRLRTLAKSDELAANGSAHALTLSEPCIAMELLEQGRAVFWSQHLRLRTEFNALPLELATKLIQTAAVLDRDSNAAIEESSDQTKAAQESEAARRRRLGDEFEVLIHHARALPGFDRFMLPETFKSISAVAIHGPVVVLLANDVICQAVVIENPDTIHQVHLPKVSLQQLQALTRVMAVSVHNGRTFLRGRALKKTGEVSTTNKSEEVLAELWRKIVRKIIDTLQLKKSIGRSRPRAILCPTGVFVHLPIHAAGVYSKGKADAIECVSDYLVPSYTPTIGALLNARRQLPSIHASEAKILLAAVSKPFKWSQLPFVVEEVRCVRQAIPSEIPMDYLGDMQCAEIKPDSAATASAVLKRLPEATIMHFACHGYQDSNNPLESGFVMQDNMLTIANLMSLNINRAFLAFLSACETAKGDKAQPDQAIHLAAAMLFAGFKSVVGTMWSMGDFDGPIVAQTIYEELFYPGAGMLDLETIPYALDSAVRKLRGSGLAASRWAPYVHMGV